MFVIKCLFAIKWDCFALAWLRVVVKKSSWLSANWEKVLITYEGGKKNILIFCLKHCIFFGLICYTIRNLWRKKLKKRILSFIFALVLVVPALFLCGCADDEFHGGNQNKHDSTKWFTETELSAVGLSNWSAPTGLTGEMSTNTWWV